MLESLKVGFERIVESWPYEGQWQLKVLGRPKGPDVHNFVIKISVLSLIVTSAALSLGSTTPYHFIILDNLVPNTRKSLDALD